MAAMTSLAGSCHVLDDQAVGEEEDAIGDRRARVVGDHDRRLTELVDRVAHQVEISPEVAESRLPGLVGEDDRGLGDEGARDGDALLLSTRQLARSVRAAIREPHLLQEILEPRLVGLRAGDRQAAGERSPRRSAWGGG